jgi:hypothetical protein
MRRFTEAEAMRAEDEAREKEFDAAMVGQCRLTLGNPS